MTAFLLLFILAGLTDINTVTPILVSMIGLGVGIDYSLFIVTRFRQLLHEGLAPRDAASQAGASAGRAVLFAGLTVAISVSGLAFFGLDFVTKLGIGSALGVLTTVLIANSLLLAVLGLLGHKIDRLKVPFLRPIDDSEAAREKTLVARWGRFVTANARFVFPAVLSSSWPSPRRRRSSASAPPTRAPSPRSRRAGGRTTCWPKASAPASTARSRSSWTSTATSRRRTRSTTGFRGSRTWRRWTSRSSTTRRPSRSSSSPRRPLRRTRRPTSSSTGCETTSSRRRPAGGDAVAYVSGQTAAFKDIADRIMERLPLFLLYIIGVTLIVLAMAFRSIVISATAAVTTLLSAFVGFGVLTLVVQEGHLLGLTGLDKTGPIETFVPPIAFAILFGLSMDYMVFIMSRIREEHVHGLKTRAAVEHGISAIGRVVVAAALIMGTVFAAFVLSADRIPKEFGLLLAVAILTDALIIRMTLVPSFFTLLGEKSWYIPRWLDRLLPNITIEPPHNGEPELRPDLAHPAEASGR